MARKWPNDRRQGRRKSMGKTPEVTECSRNCRSWLEQTLGGRGEQRGVPEKARVRPRP